MRNTYRLILGFCGMLRIVLFFASTVITQSFAQDSPQWHLPDGAIARFGQGTISEIAYSPDGTRLAVAGGIGIWLYDTVTHQEAALLKGHTREVESVSFSPDGSTLASGSYGEVHLWNVETGNVINTLTGHISSVFSISFSPDGNTIALGSSNKRVGLWDVETGNLLNTLEHTHWVNSVSFSPDGSTLASGNRDWTVGLWDVETGNVINTLTGHTGYVESVSFSPDGNTIASGSRDGTVLLWRLTPTSTPITFTPTEIADQTFEVGTPVSLTLPNATGDTPPYTYTLSPIPAGLHFDNATQILSGTPTTATTATLATYTVTDATGASASLTFTITIEVNLDVNSDGQVDVLDLVWVAVSYGMRGPAVPADVNADGVVNVQDLVAVAEGIDAGDVLPSKIAEEVALACRGSRRV